MMPAGWRTIARGAAAGLTAATVQATIGKLEGRAMLPEREDSNFAPRLIDRLARRAVDTAPSHATEWTLGAAFHYAYGAGWGAAYALARERTGMPWPLGGLALSGLIYAITFPDNGLAVRTDVERPPQSRTPQMEVVAASVTLGYGLTAAWLYERWRRDQSA